MMEIGDVEITPWDERPCVVHGMVIEPWPQPGAENLQRLARHAMLDRFQSSDRTKAKG